jgi:CubicO group peptidase (beta-lactamase class C family)
LREEYGGGYDARTAHALYSGTKSFWGIAALEAVRERLFALDDFVSGVITEFEGDLRSRITVRMLLQMTAGYAFGGLGSAVPDFARAIAMHLKDAPGTKFTYGGIPLQVFGAFFARVLEAQQSTPHDFLRTRVLEPAGVTIESWRALRDGTHPLPTGAKLTARQWLKYGRYVLDRRQTYAEAFQPAKVNPRYGLGWWLAGPRAPAGTFYASGSGGQALYAIAAKNIVIVRFGAGASHNHEAFVNRMLVSGG